MNTIVLPPENKPKKNLPEAPEFTYVGSIIEHNADMYEFIFTVPKPMQHPMFPMPVMQPAQYLMCLLKSGDKYCLTISAIEPSPQIYSEEMTGQQFLEKWNQFKAKMNAAFAGQ